MTSEAVHLSKCVTARRCVRNLMTVISQNVWNRSDTTMWHPVLSLMLLILIHWNFISLGGRQRRMFCKLPLEWEFFLPLPVLLLSSGESLLIGCVQIKTRRVVLSSAVTAIWSGLLLWLVSLRNDVWVCWFFRGDICLVPYRDFVLSSCRRDVTSSSSSSPSLRHRGAANHRGLCRCGNIAEQMSFQVPHPHYCYK
jgi:hypothetical protein